MDDNGVLVYIALLVLAVGWVVGMILGAHLKSDKIYSDAIKAGVAKYDSTTGERVWVRP